MSCNRVLATLSLAGLLTVLGAACAPKLPPRLAYDAMPSAAMGREMDYAVYTPPNFAPDEALPLVIFLHGGGDDPDCFDEATIGQRLDAGIRSGELPRVVIAVPRGDLGFWANWADGSARYADWVTEDLMPRISDRYHTQPCREGCHLMGISMGGFGSLRMALHNAQRFRSVGVISGPVFDSERMLEFHDSWFINLFMPVKRIFGEEASAQKVAEDDVFLRWRSPEHNGGMRVFVAWGDGDRPGIGDSNARFVAHLKQAGIEHRSHVYDGGHKWKYWREVIPRALRFQLQHEDAPDAHSPADSPAPR